MSRVKTFDATGIAPGGRLYAGDLNAIQDQYADLTNLGQAHSVGTLAVGEVGLILSRFGSGEGRLSGAFRTDGILRAGAGGSGVGGLLPAVYTTTQRNAIPAGSRPTGLVVFNSTTLQHEWNVGSDATPLWVGLGAPSITNTYASRPAANTVQAGTTFFASDTLGTFRSDGAAWTLVAQGEPKMTAATFATWPGPYDGQKVILMDSLTAPTYRWLFIHNAGSSNTAKWECIGGDWKTVSVATSQAIGSRGAWVDLATVGPDFVTPRQGDWDCQARSSVLAVASSAGAIANFSRIGVTTPGSDGELFFDAGITQAYQLASTSRSSTTMTRGTIAAVASGTTLRERYYSDTDGQTVNFFGRYLHVKPVRIS